MLKNIPLLVVCLLCFTTTATFAQQLPQSVEQFLQNAKYSVENATISDRYHSAHNGVEHLYVQQQYQEISVIGALLNFNLNSEGEILQQGGFFITDIPQKITSLQPGISAQQALQRLLLELEYPITVIPNILREEKTKEQKTLFHKANLALEEISVRLVLLPLSEEELRLCWEISLYEKDASDWWLAYLDAQNGTLLQKHNQVIHCQFPHGNHEGHVHQPVTKKSSLFSVSQNASVVNNSYRVYAIPVESPNHGGRSLEVSPWLAAGAAGTLGWHNDNTTTYTHSKGNNVDAYEDNNNSNGPTGGNDARVDGGANLEFDFPLDLDVSPLDQQDPIITNLFYWNNIMHDVWYQYGFDEPSGNFQEDNLGRGGLGSDYVNAEAQDNINGPGNNANFSTPTDGSNPRMQMYLWDAVGTDSLIVNTPSNVAGSYLMVGANFGGDLSAPLTGDVVEVDDGTAPNADACSALINGGDLSGNIALLDRGDCQFGTKCLNAQNAGAVAVIVCNNVAGAPFSMGPGNDGDQVTIPAVMIGQDDCTTIRQELSNTLNVTLEASGQSFRTNGDPVTSYTYAQASFGGTFPEDLTQDIIEVDDGSANPTEGCNALINGGNLSGKIALIDRGNCQFGTKCLNAQNAGAVAVVVCNNEAGAPFAMGPGDDGDQVTIPAIMISQDDCVTLRSFLPTTGTFSDNSAPPLDSDLDNGVIIHEYGHGISIRLTGGPSNSGCLSNAEQMGEGWSDFFAIWMTTPAGAMHDDLRGVGTYLIGQPTTGSGIRPTAYTTDMTVNGSTYGDIQNTGSISQPHGIGYLWCTMLWDLNWALINAHGYSADLYNAAGGAGNQIAAQLVLDGLKGQSCNPGFEDGRDAILAADVTNNGGANRNIIWNVFARRGMGFSADQGASTSRTDGSEAFDLPPDVPFMTEEELFELSPLPVDLLHFRALANEGAQQIELLWATASETNNKGFEIQRSTDGYDFQTIAWKDGQGTTVQNVNYTFYDKAVAPGQLYYYRLRQVDFNEDFTFSAIQSASLTLKPTTIRIFPNPTPDKVQIVLDPNFQGKVSLTLYNSTGQLLEQQQFQAEGQTQLELDLSKQAEGVYFLQLEENNGNQIVKRIVLKR